MNIQDIQDKIIQARELQSGGADSSILDTWRITTSKEERNYIRKIYREYKEKNKFSCFCLDFEEFLVEIGDEETQLITAE
jgi:hypothetical protein